MVDRKEVLLCSLPICPAPDDRIFMLPPVVLYQNSHISTGHPTLTSLFMLILSEHVPRNYCNRELRHFLVPYDFTTMPHGDLVCQSDCGFLKAYSRIFCYTRWKPGNVKVLRRLLQPFGELHPNYPILPSAATHPVRVTAGPWHL